MTMTAPPDLPSAGPVPRPIVDSFLYLRRGIGIIGLALPFVLVIGHDITAGRLDWRPSISSYYFTDMRNILVGSLCAIGVVLFCYKYDRVDNVLSNIAGACAVAVALFPTTNEHPSTAGRIVGGIHLAAAALLFLLLAYFCLFLFTRSDPPAVAPQNRRKIARNRVYRICGVIIVAAVVVGGLLDSDLTSHAFRDHVNPLLWCEWAAITAFGAAWLIKGRTLLKD
jgi:hypothetical protein